MEVAKANVKDEAARKELLAKMQIHLGQAQDSVQKAATLAAATASEQVNKAQNTELAKSLTAQMTKTAAESKAFVDQVTTYTTSKAEEAQKSEAAQQLSAKMAELSLQATQ